MQIMSKINVWNGNEIPDVAKGDILEVDFEKNGVYFFTTKTGVECFLADHECIEITVLEQVIEYC